MDWGGGNVSLWASFCSLDPYLSTHPPSLTYLIPSVRAFLINGFSFPLFPLLKSSEVLIWAPYLSFFLRGDCSYLSWFLAYPLIFLVDYFGPFCQRQADDVADLRGKKMLALLSYISSRVCCQMCWWEGHWLKEESPPLVVGALTWPASMNRADWVYMGEGESTRENFLATCQHEPWDLGVLISVSWSCGIGTY